jgi:hypothetical protein
MSSTAVWQELGDVCRALADDMERVASSAAALCNLFPEVVGAASADAATAHRIGETAGMPALAATVVQVQAQVSASLRDVAGVCDASASKGAFDAASCLAVYSVALEQLASHHRDAAEAVQPSLPDFRKAKSDLIAAVAAGATKKPAKARPAALSGEVSPTASHADPTSPTGSGASPTTSNRDAPRVRRRPARANDPPAVFAPLVSTIDAVAATATKPFFGAADPFTVTIDEMLAQTSAKTVTAELDCGAEGGLDRLFKTVYANGSTGAASVLADLQAAGGEHEYAWTAITGSVGARRGEIDGRRRWSSYYARFVNGEGRRVFAVHDAVEFVQTGGSFELVTHAEETAVAGVLLVLLKFRAVESSQEVGDDGLVADDDDCAAAADAFVSAFCEAMEAAQIDEAEEPDTPQLSASQASASEPEAAVVSNSVPRRMLRIVTRPFTSVASAATSAVKSQTDGLFQRTFPHVADEPLHTFSCALVEGKVLKQGYLFVTESRMCFASSVLSGHFCEEHRDIRALQKRRTALVFNNAIEVRTLAGEAFFLTSFMQRNEAFNAMYHAWTGGN